MSETEFPQAGGSYVRQADGTLLREEATAPAVHPNDPDYRAAEEPEPVSGAAVRDGPAEAGPARADVGPARAAAVPPPRPSPARGEGGKRAKGG